MSIHVSSSAPKPTLDPNPVRILKFGGTSVGSREAIESLCAIVGRGRQDGRRQIVVVSAMGGITNELLRLGLEASKGGAFQDALPVILNRHLDVLATVPASSATERADREIRRMMSELEDVLAGIKALKEFSARTRDLLLSFGELMSCELVSAMLHASGIPSVPVNARDVIVTDASHGSAQVVEHATESRIRERFGSANGAKAADGVQAANSATSAQHTSEVPVVTGFIAASRDGVPTTLGRGGSDLTAAILGAALDAAEIEIWTDVDGFMTADPRMVSSAFTLPRLSYEEAMELSYFGAKVIYPPTLLPAIAKRIPIRILNTFNPTHPGTLISESSDVEDGLIKGIASIRSISLVTIEGSGMVGLKGFSGRLFTALARQDVNVILITQASSEHSISFAIDPEAVPRAEDAVRAEFELEILHGKLHPAKVARDMSIIAVVGENMKQSKGLSGRFFTALGRSGVNVNAIAQGSSELNISAVIRSADLSKALNAVHDSLFLSPIRSLNVYCVGTGTIGHELLEQFRESAPRLVADQHLQIKVMGITNSRRMLRAVDQEIDLSGWENAMQTQSEPADLASFVDFVIHQDVPNKVLIDNTGTEKVADLYPLLFKRSVSVVTCSKLANSRSWREYLQLREWSRKSGVDFLYETNVGAGLPIIKTLAELRMSGDTVTRIEAVLSGTISYLFNTYDGSRSFAEVVRRAQELGYTEPDPRDDLNGMDFSRKMLILARELGHGLEMSDVKMEPILPAACLNAPDVERFYAELEAAEPMFASLASQAEAQGKVLRCIGVFEDGALSIRLESVGAGHPFHSLTGTDNIIAVTTTRYSANPLVIKGPGAGAAVTATGVFSDVIRVAMNGSATY